MIYFIWFDPFWIIFHPSNLMFLFVLFISIVLVVSTDSWLVTWVSLEINIMVFLPLMLKKNNKYQRETALKYFLTQVVASILILLCLTQLKVNSFVFNNLLICALLLKIAAAPLHKWMPSLVGGLSWGVLFILLVVQKIAPFLLLSLNFYSLDCFNLLRVFIVFRAIVGRGIAIFQSCLQKMLAYSSISHLAWMLSIIINHKFGWVIYFLIYALINFSIILTISFISIFYLAQLMSNGSRIFKIWICLGFLSLAGLPPFSGFFPKIAVVKILILSNIKFLLFFLILRTLVTLFIYLRIVLNSIFTSGRGNLIIFKLKKDYFVSFVNMAALSAGGLIFVSLDFKLYLN